MLFSNLSTVTTTNGTVTNVTAGPQSVSDDAVIVIGIAVFLVIFLVLIALACCCYCKRNRRNETSLPETTPEKKHNRRSSENLYYVLEPLEAGTVSSPEGDTHKDKSSTIHSVKIVSLKQRICSSIMKPYHQNHRTRSTASTYDHIDHRYIGGTSSGNEDDLSKEITSTLTHHSVMDSELIQEIVEFFSSPNYEAQTKNKKTNETQRLGRDSSLRKGDNPNRSSPIIRRFKRQSSYLDDNYDHIVVSNKPRAIPQRPSDNYDHVGVQKQDNSHEQESTTNIYDHIHT